MIDRDLPGMDRALFERAKRIQQQWESSPAPCGIPHTDVYNPCLPEEFLGELTCVTCGLRQC